MLPKMAIRFLDSIVAPFLFGLGPYFLIYILSTYPTYKTWLDTYPGAIISAGTCLIILAIGYHSVGDDPIRAATENTRWANRLPSYLLPIITETTTTPPHLSFPRYHIHPYQFHISESMLTRLRRVNMIYLIGCLGITRGDIRLSWV